MEVHTHSEFNEHLVGTVGTRETKTEKVKECLNNTYNISQVNWKQVIVSCLGTQGASCKAHSQARNEVRVSKL